MFIVFFRSVIELIKSSPIMTLFLIFITIISGIFPLLTIYSVSMMVDTVTKNDNTGLVIYSLLWVLSLSLPGLISNFVLIIQSSLSENMFLYLSNKLSNSINNIKYLNIFEDEKIYNDIDILKNNISNRPVNFVVTVGSIITSIMAVSSIAVSIMNISLYLPILSLILGIILFYVASKSQKELWAGSLRRNFQSRVMNYIFSLSIDRNSMQEIRIYNFNQFLQNKFLAMFNETKLIMNKVRFRVGILSLLTAISIIVISGVMAFNVFYLISVGAIGVSSLVFLLQGIQNIQLHTRNASEQLGWLSGHLLFFEKYLEYTDNYYHNTYLENIIVPIMGRIKKIELRNCTFKYGDKTILDDINLSINENEIVAIVGQNGAGKTTLVRILMGLLKPTEGQVLVDGIEISQYGLQNFWQKCAYVPQIFAQFKFTTEESIYLGREVVNSDLLDRPFFKDGLPEMDQQLGKEFSGLDLSGGQWQKLAIMRSLVRRENTDILFFDEPTSAIDPIVEENIYNLIEEISGNKITVYITHRMSTVTYANRIILIDNHKLVADGSHKELYEHNILYKRMFDSQADRFKI